jgi:hypothetical protein
VGSYAVLNHILCYSEILVDDPLNSGPASSIFWALVSVDKRKQYFGTSPLHLADEFEKDLALLLQSFVVQELRRKLRLTMDRRKEGVKVADTVELVELCVGEMVDHDLPGHVSRNHV